MINEGGSATPTDNTGKVKVTVADTLGYLWDKLSSDDGTVTLTKHTVNGVEHIDLSVGSIGGVAAIGDTYMVKAQSSSEGRYLGTALAVGTGLTRTVNPNDVTLSFSGKLDDLSDVDGATAATTDTMLVKQAGGQFSPDYTLLHSAGVTDLGTAVTNQATELVNRKMINQYIANLQFGILDGTAYTASSMWKSKEINHIAMSVHDDTATTAGADGYPPVSGLLSQEIGDNTRGTNYTRYVAGTKIETTANVDPSYDDPAYLSFGNLVEEDWNDTDATTKIYLDLILANGATAHAANQDIDLKVYCRSFKSLTDLAAPNTDDDTVTKQWATAGHPGDFWIQYATCEFDAATLDIANGYRMLIFNIVSKVAADPVIVIGARLRYKKLSPDIRIADTLIITEP